MAPWLIALIVTAVLNVAVILITPKPKTPKPDAVTQAQAPTASADIPIGVLWGSMLLTAPNVLWYGESSSYQYKVKV